MRIRSTLLRLARGIGVLPKAQSIPFTRASRILEIDYGHLRSHQEKSAIDKDGSPLPWFTYPAIDYLRQLDLRSKTMLEWGCGNSSLFFASRVKNLYSIEHNSAWFEKVKANSIKNQTLFLASTVDYANCAKDLNVWFDIVLIDGIEREACAEIAPSILAPGGLIILDNSDRHPNLCGTFRENEFIQVDFHGFGPINPYTWTTSIFFSRSVTISPLTVQPVVPIGGGY